jgi:hypothetical protein
MKFKVDDIVTVGKDTFRVLYQDKIDDLYCLGLMNKNLELQGLTEWFPENVITSYKEIVYLNVYATVNSYTTAVYSTAKIAEANASADCLCRIRVEIKKGQFDK